MTLFFKNIVLQLWQRPVRSIMLALFLATSGVTMVLGTYLQVATQGYFDMIAEEVGTGISVWHVSEGERPFSAEVLDRLLKCDHVIGYNRSYECLCTPISFSNYGYENHTVYSAEPQSKQILLVGNHDTGLYESFRVGTMQLIDGAFPTQQAPGVLIDQYLATKNSISVGDTLSFWDEAEDEQVIAQVRGVYQTTQPPKVDYEDYYAITGTSYVFCDWEDTFRRSSDFFDANAPVTIYADSYRNVRKILDKFESILSVQSIENDQYYCVSDYQSKTAMESGAGGLVSFRFAINTLLLILTTIVLLLCAFIVFLWMHDHQLDVGIYRVLGWNKFRIITTLLCEGAIVILIASSAAMVTGSLLLQHTGEEIVGFFTQCMGAHAQSAARLNEAIQLAGNRKTVIDVLGLHGVACVMMMLLSGVYTIHIRCNVLLSDRAPM